MPYADNMIDAPLNINEGGGDIGTALGTTVADIGCLCTDRNTSSDSAGAYPRIDKWARYKPVNLSAIGFVTEAQRRSVNFGLSATQETGPALAAARGWTYTRPTTRYRFFDWIKVTDAGVPVVGSGSGSGSGRGIGYVDLGVAPCRGFYMAASGTPAQLETYQYYSQQQTQNDINFWVILAGSDYGIGLAEMGDLTNWYLCIAVAVIENNNITPYIVTSSQAIGQGMNGQTTWQTVPIPTNNTVMRQEATYEAYAVICNKSAANWTKVSTDASLRFLPLPLSDPRLAEFQFHINVTEYSIWCSEAYRDKNASIPDNRKVWYYLRGKNSMQNTFGPLSLTVELVYAATAEDVESSTTIIDTAPYSNVYIAPTGTGDTAIAGDGSQVYLGGLAVPGAADKTLWIRVKGIYNNSQVFSSYTQVQDSLPRV